MKNEWPGSVETARLRLIPATVELARAELGDRAAFSAMLGAEIPANWPPESLADALPLFLRWLEAAPDSAGWFGWYAVSVDPAPVLAASGGFLGPPYLGAVEIGYSVLPQFRGQGYATELLSGLTRWAFGHEGVELIAAETEWANPASVAVLRKAGFSAAGTAREAGGARFELKRPAWVL
jgi:RimJ/RimL family protein N-acetyltransferase